MEFCTVLNCMDGRVQYQVLEYAKKLFNAKYVDNITEAGINRILAEEPESTLAKSILDKLEISIGHHKSNGIIVAGHYDCAGNPTEKETQNKHTISTIEKIKSIYPDIEIHGLWIDENWEVLKID